MKYRFSQIKKMKTIEIKDIDLCTDKLSSVNDELNKLLDLSFFKLVRYNKMVLKTKFSSNSDNTHFIIFEHKNNDNLLIHHYNWNDKRPLKRLQEIKIHKNGNSVTPYLVYSALSNKLDKSFLNVIYTILVYYYYISENNIKDDNIILSNFKDKNYIEVKGHHRRYKNGDIIWINPYKIKRKKVIKS